MFKKGIWGFLTLALILDSAVLWAAERNVCAHHVAQHERLKSIPRHLLAAISKVESGRVNPHNKRVEAWPWTINVQGEGHYFVSKEEAIKKVKQLIHQGIKSIDVGCMQVNLHHHKDAFRTIEQAFDPKSNVDYAARFLSNLRDNHGSWSKAVAHYHSSSPVHHIPYRKKVLDVWRQETKNLSVEEGTFPSPYLRGALWGKDRTAPHVVQRATLEELRSLRQKDPQWRRHETRLMMAQLRSKAMKTKNSQAGNPILQTASVHRHLRTQLIAGDRLAFNPQRIQRLAHNRSVQSKKPILVARKMVKRGAF